VSETLRPGPGWVYIKVGAETYLGRVVAAPGPDGTPVLVGRSEKAPESTDDASGGLFLNPCYEVQRQMVNAPQGPMLVVQAIPFGLFGHTKHAVMVVPDVVVEVGDLHEADRKTVVGWVQRAEEIKVQIRARDAGLTVMGAKA
jgi:hypothetical protein